MKDKLMVSPQGVRQDSRAGVARVVGFPSAARTGISKSKAPVVHESSFLAERGCFGRAIAPKHTVPAPHHA